MLERLVTNLFDYAGLFPPAELELTAMLKEAAQHPQTLKRPHLVSADLVVRRQHLTQLTDDVLTGAGFSGEQAVKVCLVGVPLAEASDAFDRCRAFHQATHDASVPRRVVAIEVADERDLGDDLTTAVHEMRQIGLRAMGLGVALYYEPRWTDAEWQERLPRVLRILRESSGEGRPHVGLKVRCAGPTALSAETLAMVIDAVVDAHLPLKVTQGLHHPLVEPDRHDDRIGFLGLVVAHRLRAALGPTVEQALLTQCITEQDPEAFGFDPGLRYRDVEAGGEPLDRALALPLHIGSCSLHEPDADLQRIFGPPA